MSIIKNKSKLMKMIKKSKKIFIMAHKNMDLDALGSSIGLYNILQTRKKESYLVINEKNHEAGVEKVLNELTGCLEIIRGEEVSSKLDPNESKNLLIILDTNKKELVQDQEILHKVGRKVIIDHHNKGKNRIKADLEIIDSEVSSTCEMITKLVESLSLELEPYYSTVLLSGIVLDTNNFTLKTSKETYYAAYYLSSFGASAKKVQYLLKQDIAEYIEREKLLTNVEIIDENVVIAKASPYTIYRRDDLAKIADTLLFFNNIEASFVVAKLDKDEIGISARSLGNYDINEVLSNFNGGGDSYHGAAVLKEKTISKVVEKLKEVLTEEDK